MPDSLDKHIAQVMALIGAITALISVVWTQYNKSIEEKNKQKQFELEKKHQISKETYQKLFEEKIKVYKNLYEELLKYKKRLADIGKQNYDINNRGKILILEVSTEDVNISTLRNILGIIEKNIFIISPGVEKIFNKLMYSFQLKENEFKFMLQEVVNDVDEAREESKRIDRSFFEKHQKDINKLLEEIEKEIQQMKEEIGFI